MKNPGIHKFLIGMINLHAHLAFRRYRNTENWLDDLKLVSTGYSFKISVTFLTAQLEQFGFVSTYVYEENLGLSIKDFPTAEVDWLHCVIGHRRNSYFRELVQELNCYDVISGKIANDNTNATMITYLDGLFGEVGSESADRICIGLLLPERLKDQFCFRTVKALSALRFEGSERVWL